MEISFIIPPRRLVSTVFNTSDNTPSILTTLAVDDERSFASISASRATCAFAYTAPACTPWRVQPSSRPNAGQTRKPTVSGFASHRRFRSISAPFARSATLSDIIVSRFSVLCPGFTTLEPPLRPPAGIADPCVFAMHPRPPCTPPPPSRARPPSCVRFAPRYHSLDDPNQFLTASRSAPRVQAGRDAPSHRPRSSRVISRATSARARETPPVRVRARARACASASTSTRPTGPAPRAPPRRVRSRSRRALDRDRRAHLDRARGVVLARRRARAASASASRARDRASASLGAIRRIAIDASQSSTTRRRRRCGGGRDGDVVDDGVRGARGRGRGRERRGCDRADGARG